MNTSYRLPLAIVCLGSALGYDDLNITTNTTLDGASKLYYDIITVRNGATVTTALNTSLKVGGLNMETGTKLIIGANLTANNQGGLGATPNGDVTYQLGGGFIQQHAYGAPSREAPGLVTGGIINAYENYAKITGSMLISSSFDVTAKNLVLENGTNFYHVYNNNATITLDNVTMDLRTYDSSTYSITQTDTNEWTFDMSNLLTAGSTTSGGTFNGNFDLVLEDGVLDDLIFNQDGMGSTGSLILTSKEGTILDFDRLTIHSGNISINFTSQGGNTAVYTIPEPSTATLSLLALAGFISRRRRV